MKKMIFRFETKKKSCNLLNFFHKFFTKFLSQIFEEIRVSILKKMVIALENMTVTKLKAYLKKKGVDFTGIKLKADLYALAVKTDVKSPKKTTPKKASPVKTSSKEIDRSQLLIVVEELYNRYIKKTRTGGWKTMIKNFGAKKATIVFAEQALCMNILDDIIGLYKGIPQMTPYKIWKLVLIELDSNVFLGKKHPIDLQFYSTEGQLISALKLLENDGRIVVKGKKNDITYSVIYGGIGNGDSLIVKE